jgi:hypothetical protein
MKMGRLICGAGAASQYILMAQCSRIRQAGMDTSAVTANLPKAWQCWGIMGGLPQIF